MLCDFLLGDWKNNTDDAPLFPVVNEVIKLRREGASYEQIREVLTEEDMRQMKHYLEDFEDNPLLSGGHSIPFKDIGQFKDTLRTAQKFSLTPAFAGATLSRLATPETMFKAREWFALIHDPMWIEWLMPESQERYGALLYSKPIVNGDPAIFCYFTFGGSDRTAKTFELFHFRILPDSLRQEGKGYRMNIENADGTDDDEVRFEHVCLPAIKSRMPSSRRMASGMSMATWDGGA